MGLLGASSWPRTITLPSTRQEAASLPVLVGLMYGVRCTTSTRRVRVSIGGIIAQMHKGGGLQLAVHASLRVVASAAHECASTAPMFARERGYRKSEPILAYQVSANLT